MWFNLKMTTLLGAVALSALGFSTNAANASTVALHIGLSSIQHSSNRVHSDLLVPTFKIIEHTSHSELMQPRIMETHSKDLKESPVDGNTTSGFGLRVHPILGSVKKHNGIDFGGDYGTPVVAASAGVVIKRRWVKGYGKVVYVNHGDGLQTRYAHLQRFNVKLGEKVYAGQRVGEVGSSGRATGPHLHFEARMHGRPTNPKRLLAKAKKNAQDSSKL